MSVYYEERQEKISDIKLSMGCAICGYAKYPEALDFHHINSEDKKFQITGHNIGKKDFFDELQKCTCLCANCHRHITKLQKKN